MRNLEKKTSFGFCFVIAVAAALMASPAFSQQEQDYQPVKDALYYFAEGQDAFADGNYQQADGFFGKAIGMDPANLQFQYYQALNFEKLNEPEKALDILESLLEEEPQTYRKAYFDIAAIYSRQGDYDKALAVLKQAIEQKPDDARAWLEAGVALKSLKRYDEAVADLEKAASLDPGAAQNAHTIIGANYFEQGKMDQAVAEFNKVIALDPSTRLAADAKKSLEAVAQQRRFLRPWRARARVTMAYDDNVPSEAADYGRYVASSIAPQPDLVYDDKADWYQTLELYGDYRPLNEKDMRAGVRFSLNTVGYRDLTMNNILAYRPGAFFQYDYENLHLDVRYDYTYYYTGGDKENITDYGWYLTFNSSDGKLRTHQVMPTLAIVEPHGLRTDLITSWVNKQYEDQTPNADGYTLGFVQSWTFDEKKGRTARAGYSWYKEDSDDQAYEYYYHELLAGVSSPIYWKVIGDLQYTYTRTIYKKSPIIGNNPDGTPVYLWDGDRRDRGHRITATLSRDFCDDMQLVLSYSHYINDSNVSDREKPWYDPYNYKRNLVNLAFTYRF